MAKMTLEELREAVNELDEDEQEILYLDLAFKMKEQDPEIIKSHISLLNERWNNLVSGKVEHISLEQALQEIDNIQDA